MGKLTGNKARGRKFNWTQETRSLPEHHGWKCKPGYKVFVAGQGAVRFDIPAHWVLVLPQGPDEVSVKFHDKQPPDDNWRLEVSYLLLNPNIDFSGLPVTELLDKAVGKRDERKPFWRSSTTHVKREDGIEYAWNEIAFVDPVENRVAYGRACLARGHGVQPFITLDYWEEDAGQVLPVWEEVLRTLQLGQFIADPTRRVVH